jgi:hypothetical protein
VKSDLFALGHTLLEILLGHHPRDPTNGVGHYAPENEAKITFQDEETEQQYSAGIFPDVSALQPSALADVLRGCWEQRFETAQDVLDALNRALESVEVFKEGDDRRAALGSRTSPPWSEFGDNVSVSSAFALCYLFRQLTDSDKNTHRTKRSTLESSGLKSSSTASIERRSAAGIDDARGRRRRGSSMEVVESSNRFVDSN